MTFKEYKGLDLVATGNRVLERWKELKAFEKSLELAEGEPEFIFFEGPPSANGKPGIHHVMARSIKDAICRYKSQTGWKVRRRAGWDTHGLPVELGVEKKLGISKADIGTKVTIEEYNRTLLGKHEKKAAEAHYKKGTVISELFEEDRKHFLHLPTKPFNVCRYVPYKADGYGKICLDGKHFYSTKPENHNKKVLIGIRTPF